MNTKKKYIFRLGIFTLLGFSLFFLALVIIGKKQNLFSNDIKVNTVFRNVEGLQVGNTVRFTGIDVGNVVSMRILTDTSVFVRLSIDEGVVPFIKKNSVATIGTEGLMGNKMVFILPGDGSNNSVEQGDTLPSMQPVSIDEIMQEVGKSAQKIGVVGDNLIEISEKINRGDGVFGKLFTDTSFTSNLGQSSKNIATISQNLVEVTEKVNSGAGVFGKLFSDTTLTSELDSVGRNLNLISENIGQITQKINEGQGVFGRLFVDTSLSSNLYQSSQNLAITTKNLELMSDRLTNERNILNRVVSDTALADSIEILIYRLNTAILEATEASEAIQNSGVIRAFSKKDKNGE
jgi:phospholipid/cholesterol/gamma-HCH transport system substrate-binding protein